MTILFIGVPGTRTEQLPDAGRQPEYPVLRLRQSRSRFQALDMKPAVRAGRERSDQLLDRLRHTRPVLLAVPADTIHEPGIEFNPERFLGHESLLALCSLTMRTIRKRRQPLANTSQDEAVPAPSVRVDCEEFDRASGRFRNVSTGAGKPQSRAQGILIGVASSR